MERLYRLNNYALAMCLYLLNGHTLNFSTNVPEIDILLREDLLHYFDYVRFSIGAEARLFEVAHSHDYCSVRVARGREKDLKQCLNNYAEAMVKNNLESSENVLTWKNELKAFVDKIKTSGFNPKSYNAEIDEMHIILYGVTQELFTLKELRVILNEEFMNFGTRTPEGDVDCGDGSEFHEQMDIHCNVDVSLMVNKNSEAEKEDNTRLTDKPLLLYRIILRRSYHNSCDITLGDLFGDEKEHLFPSFSAMKMAIGRINKYYKAKYNVNYLFVSKVKNTSNHLYRITYAENDNE